MHHAPPWSGAVELLPGARASRRSLTPRPSSEQCASGRPPAHRGPGRLVTAQSAVASELLTAPSLDEADGAGALALGLALGLELGAEPVPGAALAPGEAGLVVCGTAPLDAPGVGVRLSAGSGVPAVPPPTEVPLPGSFLTTAATGLPAISSTAVTVIIARANTRPVARAYFFQLMDLRPEPPR